MNETLRLRLPATSANLGPGFDAIGLALTLYLEIDATRAEAFSLSATGRNADICSSTTNNLLLETYSHTLTANGVLDPMPLALEVRNGIPLGMGCGSSAAVRLAGVALASHFGNLGWDRDRILTEASILEGHPDNTAACWLGGLAVATIAHGKVYAASIKPTADWGLLLALPRQPLATAKARAVLPSTYSSADAVANVQRASLLTAAFALGRGDLLRVAMQDKMHQPYRLEMCPLLSQLLQLTGDDNSPGMDGLGIALSGAGPAVLLLIESAALIPQIKRLVHDTTTVPGGTDWVELIECGIDDSGASYY